MSDPSTADLPPTPEAAPRDDDETGLSAGAPGPSGTGEATTAGADSSAPEGQGA